MLGDYRLGCWIVRFYYNYDSINCSVLDVGWKDVEGWSSLEMIDDVFGGSWWLAGSKGKGGH